MAPPTQTKPRRARRPPRPAASFLSRPRCSSLATAVGRHRVSTVTILRSIPYQRLAPADSYCMRFHNPFGPSDSSNVRPVKASSRLDTAVVALPPDLAPPSPAHSASRARTLYARRLNLRLARCCFAFLSFLAPTLRRSTSSPGRLSLPAMSCTLVHIPSDRPSLPVPCPWPPAVPRCPGSRRPRLSLARAPPVASASPRLALWLQPPPLPPRHSLNMVSTSLSPFLLSLFF